MDKQIIPIVKPINEAAEFRVLAARTDARKLAEAQRRAKIQRSQAAHRRRIARSLRKGAYGILSGCFALNAYLAWQSAEPELCVFPAALALLIAWAGVTE